MVRGELAVRECATRNQVEKPTSFVARAQYKIKLYSKMEFLKVCNQSFGVNHSRIQWSLVWNFENLQIILEQIHSFCDQLNPKHFVLRLRLHKTICLKLVLTFVILNLLELRMGKWELLVILNSTDHPRRTVLV